MERNIETYFVRQFLFKLVSDPFTHFNIKREEADSVDIKDSFFKACLRNYFENLVFRNFSVGYSERAVENGQVILKTGGLYGQENLWYVAFADWLIKDELKGWVIVFYDDENKTSEERARDCFDYLQRSLKEGKFSLSDLFYPFSIKNAYKYYFDHNERRF